MLSLVDDGFQLSNDVADFSFISHSVPPALSATASTFFFPCMIARRASDIKSSSDILSKPAMLYQSMMECKSGVGSNDDVSTSTQSVIQLMWYQSVVDSM